MKYSLCKNCGCGDHGCDVDLICEKYIVDAYKRGAAWIKENPDDAEFLEKAARDYADKTIHSETGR